MEAEMNLVFPSPTDEFCLLFYLKTLESACCSVSIFFVTYAYQMHVRNHCGCLQTRATSTAAAAAPAVLLLCC